MICNDQENEEGVSRFLLGMPELRLKGSLRSKRHLGYLLGVNSPKDLKGKRIVDGLIRLADKASLEYVATRNVMVEYLRRGNVDDLFRAQDHFEACILSLHRGIRFTKRLRKMGYCLPDGAPLVPKPRNFEILKEGVVRTIRELRDTLEHIEERIIEDAIPENTPDSIHIGWEKATIGSNELKYSELARWCSLIYEFSLPLVQVVVKIESK